MGPAQEDMTVAQRQLTYEEVREAAGRLTSGERRRLVEELGADESKRFEGSHDINEFWGVGQHIWRDPQTGELIDAQEYVDRERDSWGE
jgi:hypothetical protein